MSEREPDFYRARISRSLPEKILDFRAQHLGLPLEPLDSAITT